MGYYFTFDCRVEKVSWFSGRMGLVLTFVLCVSLIDTSSRCSVRI